MRRLAHLAGVLPVMLLVVSTPAAGTSVVGIQGVAAPASMVVAPTVTVTPAVTPTVTVTPLTIPQGGWVAVSGTGFAPNELVDVSISGHRNLLATTAADANGAVPATQVTVPFTLSPGVHTVVLTGATSHRSANTALTVTHVSAILTVTPTTTTPGSAITLSGRNWAPNEAITVTLSGVARPLVVAQADASGALPDTPATIPYTVTAGTHTLGAKGAVSQRWATAALSLNQVFATLVVTPAVINRGGLVTVSGSNVAPNEAITITLSGVITPLATITATAQGILPPTGVGIPYRISIGAHTLRVSGAVSKRTARAGIIVAALMPAITLSTTTAHPGTVVTIKGTGFGRQEQITLSLNGAALPTAPGPITTTNGAFSSTITIPPSLLRGANTLSAIGNESRVSAVAMLTGLLPVASTFYFAGAATMPGERASLAILNTQAQPTHVVLTFYYQHGAPGGASLDVAAHSRGTADLNSRAGVHGAFGVKVTADRVVTAALRELRAGKDDFGLLGVSAPTTRWYLAEGYTGLTFHETLTLLNPGTSPAAVWLHLLPFSGRPARTVAVTVRPQSTRVVDVNRLLPAQSLSVIATAAQPIVVERTLTFGVDGYGATAKPGTNLPATTWVFAEGTTTTRFQTFLTVLNPNTAPARVTASFYGITGGALGSRTLVVAGLSRANLKLNDFLHATGIASVVTSNVSIVVERPEYFGNPNAPLVAGSDVFGRNGASLSWAFPGGDTSKRSEFLLVYNPSVQTVAIDVTFYSRSGRVVTKRLFVPPTVRANIDVNVLFAGLAAQHGITLRAANGVGFIAEQTIFAPNFSTLQSTEGFAQ